MLKETENKCAYCETPTAVVAYGDVEHYRPKSRYWWLAYTYDNYLASCTLCNQKFKKAKFPILNRMMKAPAIRSNTTDDYISRKAGSFTPDPLNDNEGLSMDAFIEAHQTERPLLINPYLDDPGDYFAWEVDTILEEVALTALPNSDLSAQAVRAAEEAYGLNRDELKKLRYETYLEYSTHRLCVSEPDVPDRVRNRSQARIDRMLQTRQPYVGMLLFFEKMPVSNLP